MAVAHQHLPSFPILRRVRQAFFHRSFSAGFILAGSMIAISIFAPLLAEYSPYEMNYHQRFSSPDVGHLFGTDSFGRDLFARVLHGGQLSIVIGLGVMVFTGLLGCLIGAVAGYWRRLDGVIMRTMDAFMAFPTVLLAIAIASALGPSAVNVVLALSITHTPRTARVVRSSVLMVRDLDYIQAARALGALPRQIFFRHVVPNSMGPLLVQLSFVFSAAVLSEAILSFLGVGVSPTVPTWGNIISEGRNYMWEAPWITVFPGIAIVITVLGLNLIGDGIRDVLDPRGGS